MQLERTSLIVIFSRVLSKAIGFLGTAYYARELGPAVIGIFFLLQSVVGVMSVPGDLGVQGALEKRISGGGSEDELFSASLSLLLLSYILISSVAFLFRGRINDYLGLPLFSELAGILLITVLTRLFLSVMRGELKVAQSAIINAAGPVVTTVVSVALLLYGLEIHALIFGLVSGKLTVTVLAVIASDLGVALPRKEHFVSIFSYSKYNTILRMSGFIYSWTDVLMIGFFLNSSAVGVYEVAWRVSVISALTSNAVARVTFPNFSKLHAKGNFEKISETIPKATIYSIIFPIGIFFGSLVLSEELLAVVFGSAFQGGAVVLIVLLAERTIHSFSNVFFNALKSFDKPGVAFRISLLSIFLNISLNIILIPALGIEGAALAMLFSYVVSALLNYRYVKTEVQFSLPSKDIAWIVLGAGVMGVIVGGINTQFENYSEIQLFLLIALGGCIYASIVLIKTDLRKDMAPVVVKILNRG